MVLARTSTGISVSQLHCARRSHLVHGDHAICTDARGFWKRAELGGPADLPHAEAVALCTKGQRRGKRWSHSSRPWYGFTETSFLSQLHRSLSFTRNHQESCRSDDCRILDG